jgi:hypothetical protein
MNNTDKLLRAFIEASGYEIEKIVDTKLTPVSKQSGINRINSSIYTLTHNDLAMDCNGAYKRGDDECYYLKASFAVDYKITKRKFNSKPSLHKVVRQYEQGTMSYDEMLGRIALMEADYENL